ncbi:MAG: hypothetical protein ABIH69_04730, partial [bacterium]
MISILSKPATERLPAGKAGRGFRLLVSKISFLLFFCFLSSVCQAAPLDYEVLVKPEIAWQGKIVKVQVAERADLASIKGEFLGQKFSLYKEGDDFVGIVGVPTNQKVGHYDLRLIITQADGKTVEQVKNVKVWQTKFP